MQFLKTHVVKKEDIFDVCQLIQEQFSKTLEKTKMVGKFPKTQRKNPKLKQKTKTLGGSCLSLPPNCML